MVTTAAAATTIAPALDAATALDAQHNAGDAEQLQAPLPFVMLSEDGAFEIAPDAAAFLRRIKGPIAVVAIAGLYRTGKSYLLNLLLGRDRAEAMFHVGATVNACTKGIWLWGQPLATARKGVQQHALFQHLSKDTTIVFLDTEGLGSTDRSQTQDSRLFALALLLASLFVYNSRGVIDSNAIEDLSLVVHLTTYIQTKAHAANSTNASSTDGSELAAFFPDFLWVVRDFTLQLEEEGRAMTARDYFESALKLHPPVNDEVVRKNKIRSLLATFFPTRDCMTMVRPLNEEALLRNLSNQPYESLRPEFREQMEVLKHKIFSSLKPKRLMANALNGAMLVTLAQSYIDAFNSGASPVISSVWDRVIEDQCNQALELAKATFIKTFERICNEHSAPTMVDGEMRPRPIEEATMFELYEQARTAGETELAQDEIQSSEVLQAYDLQLSEFMIEHLQGSLEKNDLVSKAFNEAVLRQLYPAEEGDQFVDVNELVRGASANAERGDFDDGARMLHDKLTESRTKIEVAVVAYKKEALGPAASAVLVDFLVEKLTNGLLEWGALVKLVFRAKENELGARVAMTKQTLRTLEGKVKATQQVLAQQKESYERALQAIAERIADERVTLRQEIESKQAEIARAHLQLERLAALHKEGIDRLDAQIAEAKQERQRLEDANRDVESRRENLRLASRRQLLESERTFRREEKDLMLSQQQLLHKVIELERQLGEQDTEHMREIFHLEKDTLAQLSARRIACQDEQEALKEQTIQEIRRMKEQQDDELQALQNELSEKKALLSSLRERLEAKEAVALMKKSKSKEECVVQ